MHSIASIPFFLKIDIKSFLTISMPSIILFKSLLFFKFSSFLKEVTALSILSISDNVSAGYAVERWDTYNNKPIQKIESACSYLWDRMYVWFDGKCNPCDADYKSYLSYGNVKDNSIREIWNSQKLDKLKKDHLNHSRNKITPCDRCGQF